MTQKERKSIVDLQQQGLGYKKIAKILDVPINTVKSYCRRHPIENNDISVCQNCKQPIRQTPHRRVKKFCSNKCRNEWWIKNGTECVEHICKSCGKKFRANPKRERKYCSRVCYDNYRGGSLNV